MRIEVDFEDGTNSAGVYVHEKLPAAMGNSVAAFAHAVLNGQTKPGVWYPEEKEALSVSVCCCLLGQAWHDVLGGQCAGVQSMLC